MAAARPSDLARLLSTSSRDPTGHGRSKAAAGVPDSFSGEVGSTVSQRTFRDGLRVGEAQPAHWGWTPHYDVLEVRARM